MYMQHSTFNIQHRAVQYYSRASIICCMIVQQYNSIIVGIAFVERRVSDRANTMMRTSVAKPNNALVQRSHIMPATLPVTALHMYKRGGNDTHTTIRLHVDAPLVTVVSHTTCTTVVVIIHKVYKLSVIIVQFRNSRRHFHRHVFCKASMIFEIVRCLITDTEGNTEINISTHKGPVGIFPPVFPLLLEPHSRNPTHASSALQIAQRGKNLNGDTTTVVVQVCYDPVRHTLKLAARTRASNCRHWNLMGCLNRR